MFRVAEESLELEVGTKLGELSKKKESVSFTSCVNIIFQLSFLLMLKAASVAVGKKDEHGHSRKKDSHDKTVTNNNQLSFQDYSRFHILYQKSHNTSFSLLNAAGFKISSERMYDMIHKGLKY